MLLAWNRGEPDALDALLPLVYEELRRQAARYMPTLEGALVVPIEPGSDLVALDDALTALAAVDARKSRVVEMRFFGRAQSRRDGRGAARLARYDQARLEDGEAVALRELRRDARDDA